MTEPQVEVAQASEADGHAATRSLSRNAFALIVNAVVTSALGAGFWAFAGHLYTTSRVGEDSALVSAMMLLSSVAELDLGLALPRFLPQLGKRSAAAVFGGYAVSSAFAVVLTGVTVWLLPQVSGSFRFMKGDTGLGVVLCLATVLWNIFGVQDAVLTALRRARWVPVENAIFGVAKLILMIVWAHSTIKHGIFIAWVVPMAVMVIPVNFALFKWAIPHHARTSKPAAKSALIEGSRRRLILYLTQDYVASLLIQGATNFMPVLVLILLGAERNGYFYMAFTISTAFDQLSQNVGLSLTVESAFDERQLALLTRHIFLRIGILLAVGVISVDLLAPYLLAVFGHQYSTHAVTILRLLMIGCVPQVVLNLYQAIERVRGNGARILGVTVGRMLCVVLLIIVLGKADGLSGVGWGWVIGHFLVTIPIVPVLYRVMRKQ
jgi:O-antigen/teichoic acid export membrane protein